LPGWLVEAADYVWFADRWRWTPNEVDALPLPLADQMRHAALALDKGRERRQRRDMEQARQGDG